MRIAVASLAILAAAACSDPTSSNTLIDDSALTLDIAASAGDAAADMITTMIANETDAGGSPELAASEATGDRNFNVTRSHTCYDAAGAVVTNCQPFTSVRKIVTAATINGSRSSTRTKADGSTVTWTGVVHRTLDDTTTRVFTGPTETARVHDHVALGHDTTTFTDGTTSRRLAEAIRDSVRSLTFNLPRGSNPWPVSGSIVRNATVNILVTRGETTGSATRSHRIEVLFPADAQGNVTLNVNDKTCQLNLVTRRVTNCQ